MNGFINDFMNYLSAEKKMAQNSLDAYKRDVQEFGDMIRDRQGLSLSDATNT